MTIAGRIGTAIAIEGGKRAYGAIVRHRSRSRKFSRRRGNLIWTRTIFDDTVLSAAANNLNNLVEDTDWDGGDVCTLLGTHIDVVFHGASADEVIISASLRFLGLDNDNTLQGNHMSTANASDEDFFMFRMFGVNNAVGPISTHWSEHNRVKRKIKRGNAIVLNLRLTRATVTCSATGVVSSLLRIP